MGQFDIALRALAARHTRTLAEVLVPSFHVDSATWIETQLTARERRMDRALDLPAGMQVQRAPLPDRGGLPAVSS